MEKRETEEKQRFRARRHSCSAGANWQEHRQQSRVWTGAFLLLIGVVALLRFSLDLPDWLFSWQMLLIALGVFIGLRHRFRGPWIVPILIGGIFLLRDFFPGVDPQVLWPMALIVLGLFLMFRPRRQRWRNGDNDNNTAATAVVDPAPHTQEGTAVSSDLLDATSVFGGIKKTILSKDFKGGDIVNIMGGTELNLSQADIRGTVILEVTQIFGGTKIVVPPHWEVKPEMAAIFGGIDDKRYVQPGVVDTSKVLLLKGTSIFGGIEVRSF